MAMNRDMMAKIAQMGAQLQKAQADLAEKRVEGTSGGGAVHLVLTGGMKVESMKIDKEVIDPEDAEMLEGAIVFHAGTALDSEGRLVTAGGRVLAVTGTGATLAEARERAYAGVDRIHFEGALVRRDIAATAAAQEGIAR